MGFEVEIEDLRTSADAARDALRAARDVSAPGDLRGIRPAVPGAAAAAVAASVADGWEEDVAAWVRAARRYARHLDACADRYAADDALATAAFGRIMPPGAR